MEKFNLEEFKTQHNAKAEPVTERLDAVIFSEFKAKPREEKIPLIYGILKQRESMLLHAPSGVGKSWVCQYLAHILTTGDSSGPWSTDFAHKVLYIDGELDPVDFIERSKVIEKCTKPLNDNLVVYNKHDVGDYGFNVLNPETQQKIINSIEYHNVSLVVIDNMRCLSDLSDENSANEGIQVLNAFLDRLHGECNCGAIVVHHSRKASEGEHSSYSGNTNWERAMSVVMSIKQEQEYNEDTGVYKMEFKCTKRRNAKFVKYKGIITVDDNEGVYIEGPKIYKMSEQSRQTIKLLEKYDVFNDDKLWAEGEYTLVWSVVKGPYEGQRGFKSSDSNNLKALIKKMKCELDKDGKVE